MFALFDVNVLIRHPLLLVCLGKIFFFARIRLKNETYYNILSAVEHKEPPNWFISQNEETRVVLSLFFQNLFIATADFFCILLIFIFAHRFQALDE